MSLSRRELSRRSLLASLGVLVVGVHLPGVARASPSDSPVDLNAFVGIAEDGTVTVALPSSEMGQGIATALPMVVAEELDADWSQVRATFGTGRAYRWNIGAGIHMQVTGGSQSVIVWRAPMAEAGARARAMLIAAAARRWGVAPEDCHTEAGVVRCGERSARYGELAAEAAGMRPPGRVPLKDPATYRIIGSSPPRLDSRDKVTGAAVFGIDVRVPGLRFASVVACPVFGGRVGAVDDRAARAVPGVSDVLVFEDWVAVVADGSWPARRGVDALVLTWDEGPNAALDSASISRRFAAALDHKGKPGRQEGNAPGALEEGAIEARYEVPYLDHAPLEPMNCTVHVRADAVEVWAPTQAQTLVERKAKEITGRKTVLLHTTLLGGGFGRRGQIDFVEQALHVGMAVDAPVQVLWTREECFRHGFYRPGFAGRARGRVENGRLTALHLRIAGDNTLYRWIPRVARNLPPVVKYPMEGILHTCAYNIENLLVEWVPVETPIPIGFFRAVSYNHNLFFLESFLDELASAAGIDPLAFRLAMLDKAPRYKAVLEKAATEAGWGQAPVGRFQGLALGECFGSIVAQVAEISMIEGRPKVHRVTAAVDCGPVLHPGLVKVQVMGGVIFGLSSALGEEIRFERGRVVQSNFHDYPLLRMCDAPQVDVHIVENPTAPIGGVGEIGTPFLGPAVANAIFAATGKRLRSLPLYRALESA